MHVDNRITGKTRVYTEKIVIFITGKQDILRKIVMLITGKTRYTPKNSYVDNRKNKCIHRKNSMRCRFISVAVAYG